MKCQIHADLVRAPSHTLTAPWQFSMWAFDIIGPFTKTVENTNRPAFILTATEYYTKWAEAEAFTEIKASTVVKFIMKNIIARFEVPKILVTDNGPQFIAQQVLDLCDKLNIELHHSSPFYPQSNETKVRILKKTVETPLKWGGQIGRIVSLKHSGLTERQFARRRAFT